MKKINTVLIIDDDPIYNYLTKKLIEKFEITDHIITAVNGADAIQKILEFAADHHMCPELIFADMEMPLMNGVEFIELFHRMKFKNKDNARIIVNSATITPLYREKLQSLNIDFYLQKPLCSATMKEIITTFQSLQVLTALKKTVG